MIDNILIISFNIMLSFDRFFIWFIIQQLLSSFTTVQKPCMSSSSSLLSSLSLDSVTKNIRNIWTMQAISWQTRVLQVRWIRVAIQFLDVHKSIYVSTKYTPISDHMNTPNISLFINCRFFIVVIFDIVYTSHINPKLPGICSESSNVLMKLLMTPTQNHYQLKCHYI